MRRSTLVVAAAVVALGLGLTGCGGGGETPEAQTYDGVEALRDAYVQAGGQCDDWQQTNKVKGAAQSGECGDSIILSTYLSPEAAQQRVADTKASPLGEMSKDWLVGGNWIINAEDLGPIKEKMGGTIVSFQDQSSPSAAG